MFRSICRTQDSTGISAVGSPGWTFTYRDLVVGVLGWNQEENLELLS